MSARNKAVIEEVNAAFARNDTEGFLTHCADDFVWTMVGEPPVQGKDAVRAYMAAGPSEPPVFTVDDVVAEGNLVVATGDMTMQENGADATYAYCDVWRFDGESLVELKAYVVRTEKKAS